MDKYKREKIGIFEIVSYKSENKTENYLRVKDFIATHINFDIKGINKKRTSYGLKHIIEKILGVYVSNYDVKCAMAELGIKGVNSSAYDINYSYPISEKEYKRLEMIRDYIGKCTY